MKSLKKIIVAASLCAAMTATAAFGTLAYFTSQADKTNTFTVGNLSIVLTEENWELSGSKDALNLTPGREIAKDPVITVKADSVESFVRMVVEMPKTLYNASNFGGATGTLVVFEGMSENWVLNSGLTATSVEDSTVNLVFDYNAAVATADSDTELDALFTSIKIADTTTNEQLKAFASNDNFDIKIFAYATQTEGFNGNVNTAFSSSFDNFKTE